MEERIGKIKGARIAAFLGLSFGLAWPVFIVGDYFWHGVAAAWVIHSIAMLMPGAACVVVKRWLAREDLSGVGWGIGGAKPYAVVVLACFVLWGLPRAVDLSFGGGHLLPFSGKALLSSVLILFIGIIPAFGEELGWRGFLLPALMPLGARKALLLHGAIWGAWHWPLLIVPALEGRMDGADLLTGMLAMTVVSALLGTVVGWIWLRFGSIWLVTAWHFSYDYFRDVPSLWIQAGGLQDLLGGVSTAIIVLCGIVFLVVMRPNSGTTTRSSSSSSPRTTSGSIGGF